MRSVARCFSQGLPLHPTAVQSATRAEAVEGAHRSPVGGQRRPHQRSLSVLTEDAHRRLQESLRSR